MDLEGRSLDCWGVAVSRVAVLLLDLVLIGLLIDIVDEFAL
jgi:hypothetical protein